MSLASAIIGVGSLVPQSQAAASPKRNNCCFESDSFEANR